MESDGDHGISGEDPLIEEVVNEPEARKDEKTLINSGSYENHKHFQTLRMVSYKCFMRKMSRTIFLIHTSSSFP